MLSLIVWSLVVVVSVKYLVFVIRADNDGEGGILVLTSLLPQVTRPARRIRTPILLGLFGTALLYGDGMITPAISVLAAVEGTEVAAPGLAHYAVPVSVAVLVALFSVQRQGTGVVGRAFGPIMMIWFVVIAVLGVSSIVHQPRVLAALSPHHAARFFLENGMTGLLALGSVFLVVTGGEALYADLGHFGRRPITRGWFAVVLPALLLNYFGQGALLLSRPASIDSPFYRLAPSWASLPLTLLATAAAVIASQALISGAFSLTMQAARFGYLPRMKVVHTSATERGQIYVPGVNWVLMVACIGLVVGFQTSSRLAAAYGVAVTMTMVITTLLFYLVARSHFGWPVIRAGAVCGAFLLVDLAFLGANLPKVPHGGWFPLVVGGALVAVLTTWFTGRRIIRERGRRGQTPLDAFLQHALLGNPPRVAGTAVYLFGVSGMAPPPLLYNFRSNRVLHDHVVMVNVVTERVPRVHPVRRVSRRDLGDGIEAIELHYGFMDRPVVGRDLEVHAGIEREDATYFVGRESVVVADDMPGMARWREHLFAFLRRNATSAAVYFRLPPDRVFEISTPVEL